MRAHPSFASLAPAPARPLHRARATRGFTLIELLTVIAIIGILAAIIIPTTVAVRRRAASTRSASNLRQFGTAYLAYANDNKNRLPPALANNGTADQMFGYGAYMKGWDYFLLPYLFPRNGHNNLPKAGETLMMHPNDENGGAPGSRRSYAANTGATPRNVYTTLSKIVTPSRLILNSERPYGNGIIGGASFADNTPSNQVRDIPGSTELNYGSTFNYLFVDGHVQALRWEVTVDPSVTATDKSGKRYTGTATVNLWNNL